MRYTAAVMSKELYDPTVTLKLRRGRTNSRTSIWKPILNRHRMTGSTSTPKSLECHGALSISPC